ncbi:hypothetical protein THAOC_15248 [Thalassiosira oceanica]|uniref:Reverse transcriptase domain-containing protein n=1 Tax=Thalassiosira oceanica TaxID=159749 RepID=K0SFA4_THAOC|nr:hypothetical protein THAOC_15248 [Thalassiosira oceanica]|eukprot:EJK64055.1 hypothetical protein THAOC_15248 [Thalassiosira oceanica]
MLGLRGIPSRAQKTGRQYQMLLVAVSDRCRLAKLRLANLELSTVLIDAVGSRPRFLVAAVERIRALTASAIRITWARITQRSGTYSRRIDFACASLSPQVGPQAVRWPQGLALVVWENLLREALFLAVGKDVTLSPNSDEMEVAVGKHPGNRRPPPLPCWRVVENDGKLRFEQSSGLAGFTVACVDTLPASTPAPMHQASPFIPIGNTYVAFVDLVKAFDTADHKLLIEILVRYGAPPHLCKVIERMYTDLTVVLKIGKSVEEILQETAVLFLFLMNAFADSLEAIWESKGLEKVQAVRASDEDFENGIGILSEATRQNSSQTRQSFFSKKENAPALANEPFNGSIVQSVPVAENAPVEIHKPSWRERREASAERAKKKAELEKTRYFSLDLDQTQPIAVKDGFVTFTMHFKYLGSFISYNLRDEF